MEMVRAVGRKIAKVLRLSVSTGVPRRSCCVSLAVGTTLTLINQGTLLIKGIFPPWWKIVLTYVVPYLVSSYGAVSAMLAAERAEHESTEICIDDTGNEMDKMQAQKVGIDDEELGKKVECCVGAYVPPVLGMSK